jgi:hypothetical protein
MIRGSITLAIAAAALALPAQARGQLLDTKVVGLEAAKAVAAAAESYARGRQWQVAIAVVDIAGEPIVLGSRRRRFR